MRALAISTGVAGVVLMCVPATAGAQTRNYVDLMGGIGYSTNPFFTTGGGTGSAYARMGAFAVHNKTTERSDTALSAYVENSAYLSHYPSRQIFSLNARTSRKANERWTLYGALGFDGDFGGQLRSRFYSVPSGPVVVDPNLPPPPTGVDPELNGLSQRQYRLSGQVGAQAAMSELDTLTFSAAALRVFTANKGDDLDYNQYDGSVGYERKLNERLAVGGRLVAQKSDYPGDRSVTSIGPQATVRARLSERWDLSAALGFVRTNEDRGGDEGSHNSLDLAAEASLCRVLEAERLCGRVSRRAQRTIASDSSTGTSAAIDYFRQLTARDTIQGTASYVRSGFREGESVIVNSAQRSSFATVAGSYERKLNDRLFAGVNVAARHLSRPGPDPKADIGGTLRLRYRLGSVR